MFPRADVSVAPSPVQLEQKYALIAKRRRHTIVSLESRTARAASRGGIHLQSRQSKRAKSLARLRPQLSEFSKTRFRPQIATVLTRSRPEAASKPASSWSFGSHLLQELPSPPPVFCHPRPVARTCLPEVGLVAKAPAGLISALSLEDFSSVGFDTSPNSLLRKGLKQISYVEIKSDLWIAGQPVQKPVSNCRTAAI